MNDQTENDNSKVNNYGMKYVTDFKGGISSP